ncbi:MAG: chromosomal replication initiator protein DnaA [Anaerolineae bacterium]|nr:chromosomal replication initiator protein DnaA [Anaerolineae bacterium]
MNYQQAWQAALGQLQMEMPKSSFDTWVRSAELVSYKDYTYTIGVPNAYARDWLEDRLSTTITRILSGMMDAAQKVNFIVWHKDFENVHVEEKPVENAPVIKNKVQTPASINPRYTFDSFVVGQNNRMAHAACMAVGENAVTENPSRSYNPLFLYGGVGLGKTHLLHAIGNAAAQRGLKVLYVSSEEFTNDMIQAIQSRTTAAFRERYRETDVLLVDDIQFFIGKESTLEEFFHTFNTLYGQNKQIVISSDRSPKAMAMLEDRLRSRFEWGLTVDIQPPDLETRIAILKSKAELSGRNVPDEILELIAQRIRSSVRELEGALTRVMAYSELSGQPLTTSLVNMALVDLLPHTNTIQPEQVVQTVAHAFNIKTEQILGRNRSRDVALPRHVAMYLMREDANISLPQIGEKMGGRDHTTVMHACDRVADLIERDDYLRRQIVQIREQLYGRQALVA